MDLMKLILWVGGLTVAILTDNEYGCGILAIICSLLVAMYVFGFREKWSSETVSAYSVLNKNQYTMPGSLTARQFDAQLRGDIDNDGGSLEDTIDTTRHRHWGQGRKLADNVSDHHGHTREYSQDSSEVSKCSPTNQEGGGSIPLSSGIVATKLTQRRDLARTAALKRMSSANVKIEHDN